MGKNRVNETELIGAEETPEAVDEFGGASPVRDEPVVDFASEEELPLVEAAETLATVGGGVDERPLAPPWANHIPETMRAPENVVNRPPVPWANAWDLPEAKKKKTE